MSVFALQLDMFIILVNTLSKVQEDLLPEAQSGMVIKLLEEVGNSVKENAENAVSTILSCCTSTPTSSPCTVRKVRPTALEVEAVKVRPL